MVNGLFLCVTLTSRRMGHNPGYGPAALTMKVAVHPNIFRSPLLNSSVNISN